MQKHGKYVKNIKKHAQHVKTCKNMHGHTKTYKYTKPLKCIGMPEAEEAFQPPKATAVSEAP